MNLTNKIYQNEDSARKHLEGIRWPDGISCPHCGGTEKIASVKMMSKPSKANPESVPVKGYYHCGDCRDKFTVRTGTIYERSHVPLHKWVMATQLLCSSKKGMSAHQLHRMIGVTYKTAWFMFHRIRESMIDTNPGHMGGPGEHVQADETYIGKKKEKATVTTSGRPFIMSSSSMVTTSVEKYTAEAVTRILQARKKPHANVFTKEEYFAWSEALPSK